MRYPPPIWCLERLELFRAIARDQLEHVARQVRPVRLARRQMMTIDDAEQVFIVGVGAVKLCRTSWLGRRLVEAVLQPGDVFGRISDGPGRSSIIEALDYTTLLRVARGVFMALIQSEPKFSYRVVQMLEDRQRQLERQVDSLVFNHTLLAAGSNRAVYRISLEVVPEPATLACLGLGGLALLRRRRN